MDSFDKEIRIVLVGKTGTGKSSTGNTILGREEFKAAMSAMAVTGKSAFGTRQMKNKKLSVVDTPGILDTHRDRDEMNREIIKSVGLAVPGPHAVLYVVRIGDKLTDEELSCIQIFTNLFGEQVCKFLIVVFTRGNELDGTPLTDYVKDVPDQFKNLLKKCSNRMLALDNRGTKSQKTEAVDNLLAMIETMVYGQTYYSNDMLDKAKEAFLERLKELKSVDKVKKEIQTGGNAFKKIGIALGLGGLVGACITGVVIAGPAVAATTVGGAVVVAAEAVAASPVGGAVVVAAEAVAASPVGGAVVVAAEAVASATASGAGVLAAKVAVVGSLCSIS